MSFRKILEKNLCGILGLLVQGGFMKRLRLNTQDSVSRFRLHGMTGYIDIFYSVSRYRLQGMIP